MPFDNCPSCNFFLPDATKCPKCGFDETDENAVAELKKKREQLNQQQSAEKQESTSWKIDYSDSSAPVSAALLIVGWLNAFAAVFLAYKFNNIYSLPIVMIGIIELVIVYAIVAIINNTHRTQLYLRDLVNK